MLKPCDKGSWKVDHSSQASASSQMQGKGQMTPEQAAAAAADGSYAVGQQYANSERRRANTDLM